MSDKKTNPPPPRRDPRADPDEGASPSELVDVVNVERAIDPISAVAVTMRRELARLSQQASVFERTVEEHRRERTEALDRAERATEHALQLEARIARMEDELQSIRRMHESALEELDKTRAERDALAFAADSEKETAEELARVRADLDLAYAARDKAAQAVTRLETELAEVRKREHREAAKAGDREAELAALREKTDRMTAEIVAAYEEVTRSKADAVKARQELADTRDAAARADEQRQHERATREADVAKLERQLAEARAAEEKLAKLGHDLDAAEKALDEARSDASRIARELDAARSERDVQAERATMLEHANLELRVAEERTREKLDAALKTSAVAETRAIAAERARSLVEDGVRQLRDEITNAFARINLVAPSILPPAEEPAPPETTASPPIFEPSTIATAPPATRAATPGARREELIARLDDPFDARTAADALRGAPEWLRGPPPAELLEMLDRADYDAERPVFEVARMWERDPLCRALLDRLHRDPDARRREHTAWLLKHLAAAATAKELVAVVTAEDETVGVRRWLIEALDRLAATRAIGWPELGEAVRALSRHPDATLRDGTIGILSSLEASEEKRKVLVDILRHDDDEVVLAGAVDALATVVPIEIEPDVVDRLLGHPSERVQRSVRDLVTRSAASTETIEVD